MYEKKLKGGILYYVLIISLLSVVSASGMLFYFYVERIKIIKIQKYNELQEKLNTYLQILLNDNELHKENEINKLFYSKEKNENILITIKNWGIYDLYILKTEKKDFNAEKISLTGNLLSQKNKFALYLPDNNFLFYLGEGGKIVGDCYLPEGEFNYSMIKKNKKETNAITINGKIYKSEKQIPVVPESILQRINDISKNNFNQETNQQFEKHRKYNITNSFNNKTRYINSNKNILLENCMLKGNVIINSAKEIEVDSTAHLEDIILISPKIIIQQGFLGKIQLYASEKIMVEENVHLKYPSVVCVNSETKNARIEIKNNSKISGMVIMIEKEKNQNSTILLDEKTKLNGQLYTQGNFELKGNVNGQVLCNKLIYRNSSGIFENHLIEGKIDFTELPEEYVGIDFLENENTKAIIKYLY